MKHMHQQSLNLIEAHWNERCLQFSDSSWTACLLVLHLEFALLIAAQSLESSDSVVGLLGGVLHFESSSLIAVKDFGEEQFSSESTSFNHCCTNRP